MLFWFHEKFIKFQIFEPLFFKQNLQFETFYYNVDNKSNLQKT